MYHENESFSRKRTVPYENGHQEELFNETSSQLIKSQRESQRIPKKDVLF